MGFIDLDIGVLGKLLSCGRYWLGYTWVDGCLTVDLVINEFDVSLFAYRQLVQVGWDKRGLAARGLHLGLVCMLSLGCYDFL